MGQILKFSAGWGLNLLTTAVVTNCHTLSALEECDLFSHDSLGQNAHAGLMGPSPRVGRAGCFWSLPRSVSAPQPLRCVPEPVPGAGWLPC